MKENQKQEELKYLLKRLLIFYDFFFERYGAEIYKSMKDIVQKEYEKQNLRGLRAASNDFTDQLRGLPFKDATDLQAILKKELGEDYALVEKKRLERIERIILRKRILNNEEYRLIQERTDEIYADVSKTDELKKLNGLLTNLDESKRKR